MVFPSKSKRGKVRSVSGMSSLYSAGKPSFVMSKFSASGCWPELRSKRFQPYRTFSTVVGLNTWTSSIMAWYEMNWNSVPSASVLPKYSL